MTSGGDVSAQPIRRMTLPPIYGLESHEKLSGGGGGEESPSLFCARFHCWPGAHKESAPCTSLNGGLVFLNQGLTYSHLDMFHSIWKYGQIGTHLLHFSLCPPPPPSVSLSLWIRHLTWRSSRLSLGPVLSCKQRSANFALRLG